MPLKDLHTSPSLHQEGDRTSARETILAKSWTTVAPGYERILVPRFAAWTNEALCALRSALDNQGTPNDDDGPPKALVLCCGPGQELVPVAKILGPNAKVLGIDLAPGMIEAARNRIESEDAEFSQNISIQVGDASNPPSGHYRAILSVFGLQQLPDPVGVIKEWVKALELDGVAVVCYWPPDPPLIQGEETGHPFKVWEKILKRNVGRNGSTDAPWDTDITLAAKSAGADVLEDKFLIHEISWNDPKDLWDGMSRAGPWHAMRLRRGDDYVDELGEEFQAAYPAGKPLSNKCVARMLVLRRCSQ